MKLSACLTASFLLALHNWATAQEKPNIIYILADDMGYGDVRAYNPESKISTPNIDRLAEQGIRFTDAHSPSSVCTPTRYAIMTGTYPWRSRLPVGVLRGYGRSLIEQGDFTVSRFLQQHGYHTAVIGKWHLGLDWAVRKEHLALVEPGSPLMNGHGLISDMDPDHIDFAQPPAGGPSTLGFDYSFILPASLDMEPYCFLEQDSLTELPTAHTPGNDLNTGYTGAFWRAGKAAPSFRFDQVLPDLTGKAVRHIEQRARHREPFFLYLPLPAPHTPWLPTDAFQGTSGAGVYGDFVQQVDDAVGRILNTVDSLGLSENTLIVFTSDNGPYWRPAFSARFGHRATGLYRGMKGDAWEGGHRIPFIVRWPAVVKPGAVSEALTSLTNLSATCAEILQAELPQGSAPDSYGILPVLRGISDTVARQPAIVHQSSIGYLAIRRGPWKLIDGLGSGGFSEPQREQPRAGGPTGQLYHLKDDPTETQDRFAEFPDTVETLRRLLAGIKAGNRDTNPPNIVVILADDMGYSDIGCYGGEISTPNLDKLAKNGLRFKSFYNAGRCCPTRASLLTGQYPHDAGMGHMVSYADEPITPGPYQGFLHTDRPTLAEALRATGYGTYMAGKWHVGERPQHWPRERGFDRYFGLISGASSYYEIVEEKRKRLMVLDDAPWQPPADGFYMTDAFTDSALAFIDQHENHRQTSGRPFFLYLAYTAPHWPLHAPDSVVANYENQYLHGWDAVRESRFDRMKTLGIIDNRYVLSDRPEAIPAWDKVTEKSRWARKMAVYAAMIEIMDNNIGRVLSQLEERNLLDNTLIVFLSDNGACAETVERRGLDDTTKRIGERGSYTAYGAEWANASNTPFRKYKKFMHEGGILTPSIWHWPRGLVNAGRISDGIGHVMDLMPTLLELSGAPIPSWTAFPGVSMVPQLKDQEPNGEKRTLAWEHEGNEAVRSGNWKLVKDKADASWALYDLSTDPTELRDVSRLHPEKVELLIPQRLHRVEPGGL